MKHAGYKKKKPKGYCCPRCDSMLLKTALKTRNMKKRVRREGKDNIRRERDDRAS